MSGGRDREARQWTQEAILSLVEPQIRRLIRRALAGDGIGDLEVDHGSLVGLDDDDHVQYVLRNQWLQNGFIDEAEVSLSWDDGTRTLTVDAVGASFRYTHSGVLYSKTTPDTETITDTEGLWIFYYDGASLSSLHNPSHVQIDDIIENDTLVAYVYWDATNSDGRLMVEWHGYRMSPATHHWIHDAIGAVFVSGMVLSDFVIDDLGSDAEDAQFSVASGVFYDEDITHLLSAVASTVGLEIWYLDGSNWRWATNAGFSILTTGTGRMAWNDSGLQTEVTNARFALCHVFATNITADDGTSPKYIAVQGQAEYMNQNAARLGAEVEITALATGVLPIEELVPVGTVIFQTNNAYTNAVKSRTRTTAAGDNYVDWRASGIMSAGGSISDHGSLAGLADDDHLQYLPLSAVRALTGQLDTGDNNILIGDGRLKGAMGGSDGQFLRLDGFAAPPTWVPTTLTHAMLSSVGVDDHHPQVHTILSHDTTATGANLTELTGGGDTSLHLHSIYNLDAYRGIIVSNGAGTTQVLGAFSYVQVVLFDAVESDPQSDWTAGTQLFTASVAGRYALSVSIFGPAFADQSVLRVEYRINGGTITTIATANQSSPFAMACGTSGLSLMDLSIGDTLGIWVQVSTAAAITLGGPARACRLQIWRISA